ncbi:MAG: DUF2344 domain-containing protein, partial [Candidatus Saganbacteria bacterium]|nr:DUF2344 domain-containing protein [Candidatus Saganbacteria bacterium]
NVLPPGIRVLEANICHPTLPSVAAAIKASEYVFELKDVDGIQEKVDAIMEQKELKRKRISKGKEKEIDLRPMIFNAALTGNTLAITVQTSEKGSLKPSEFLELLGNPPILATKRTKILVDGLRPL